MVRGWWLMLIVSGLGLLTGYMVDTFFNDEGGLLTALAFWKLQRRFAYEMNFFTLRKS